MSFDKFWVMPVQTTTTPKEPRGSQLTRKQRQVLTAIQRFSTRKGYMPSVRELGRELGGLAHLQVARYGNFMLTDAIRPSFDLQVMPKAGYRHDSTLLTICLVRPAASRLDLRVVVSFIL